MCAYLFLNSRYEFWCTDYLLCVEFVGGFFAQQCNKCALLCFLLAVWNCFICTPCINSPSKKAEEASRMSEASKQLQAYMTTPLVDPPAHPSLFPVAFSFPFTHLYCGFLVVYLFPQMQGRKFDLNSHLVFFSLINSRLCAQWHLFNPQPSWRTAPEPFQVSPNVPQQLSQVGT